MDNTYITYDNEADVLYILFGERTPRTRSRDHGHARYVEYNDRDEPIAIEFLDASHGINLNDLPNAEVLRNALNHLHTIITPTPTLA